MLGIERTFMAVKTLTQRKIRKHTKALTYGQKLRALIKDQRALATRLAKLIEDEEDHLAIERAKKRDAEKPSVSWEEAKKRLGLKFD
jgi:hypothetical protein